MFQGLRTNIFRVRPADLEKAKIWYSKLLGKAPYFDEPFYVGFNVAGFELALDPSDENVTVGNNIEIYWGVTNIEEAFGHCLKLNAQSESPIRNVGGDIKVAKVRDPFGNLFGLIENPGFKIE